MKNVKHFFKLLLKAGKKPSNIWYFLTGHYRLWIFYSPRFSFLMRSHIYDQINFRLETMDRECFQAGACKKCGCEVPALQMASKACDKPCYTPFLSRTSWKKVKPGFIHIFNSNPKSYLKMIKSINDELDS